MKKILSILAILMAFGAMPAVAASHMSFMGIPINGSLSSFCDKLVSQRGLKIEKRDNERGVYILSGKYLVYDNCEFYVFDNDNTDQVYSVEVYLPACSSWSSIKTQYNKVVSDYRQLRLYKYDASETSFEAPYREGDGDEVAAVKSGKVTYFTRFVTSGRDQLIVDITKFMQVKISFFDYANDPDYQTGS